MSKTCAIFQYSESILSELLSFLSTLEEDTPNDLEEAADNHIREVVDAAWEWETRDIKDAFIAGAEWQKEQDDKELSDILTIAHLQGADQMKEQMLKGAVEGKIGELGFHNAVYLQEPKWTNFLDGFKKGDKVRIIICKKEDEK